MKFYVGGYTRLGGPGVCLCDLTDGRLSVEAAGDVKLADPTYVILSKDRQTLFAVSTTESDGEWGGSAATYDLTGGGLRLTSLHSTAGTAPCHMALSADERFLYVANYSSGSLSVFPVENGRLLPRVQLIRHEGTGPNEKRQECAHVHFAAFHPEDGRLYAVDLGIDAVMIYRADRETGLLTLDERADMPAGLGPRHLAFRGDMMYVAHELGNAVSALRRVNGRWALEQTLSTLPAPSDEAGTVAAIRVLGNRLYVSNRRQSSLAEFAIDEKGNLAFLRALSTFGEFPRDFVLLDESHILVSNQDSGDVRLLALDEAGVRQIGEALPMAGATCVCPAEA